MEQIARVSKGTNMDQVYLPKNRIGMSVGEFVVVSPLERPKKQAFKPYFYQLKDLELLKIEAIKIVFNILNEIEPENIIITGSFLEKGFRFNDIDILVIKKNKPNLSNLKGRLEKELGITVHLILIDSGTLSKGLSTDPLYEMMLSKCISKERMIFKVKREIDYKLLDIQLLKSKSLPENFELLKGHGKYYLTLNMVSILLFMENKKLSKDLVDKTIERVFGIKIQEIKDNLLDKDKFIKKYKEIYKKTFDGIMEKIK